MQYNTLPAFLNAAAMWHFQDRLSSNVIPRCFYSFPLSTVSPLILVSIQRPQAAGSTHFLMNGAYSSLTDEALKV